MPTYGTQVQVARKLIKQIDIPILPDELVQLQQLLQQHEMPSIKKLVELISRNPYLAAELISLANTSIFNSKMIPVQDLESALFRLGINNLRDYVTSIHIKKNFLENSLSGLSYHSQIIAEITSLIALETNLLKPSEAYLLGLIHDIGSFAIHKMDENYGMTFHHSHQSFHAANDHDCKKYGTSHSALGYVIAHELHLPKLIAHTILLHHEQHTMRIKEADLRRNVALLKMAHFLEMDLRFKNSKQANTHRNCADEQEQIERCLAVLGLNQQHLKQIDSRLAQLNP
ncbi:HDOD domain-containing protein [Thiomicrorhabdus sp. 6S3-12]|uniref:HDOD domain-containing protein n=1 Tax=Thiomicrorhabdus sp. 6S3-12 TaxID=2819681 RepID=UPI001AAD638E|nr:HDOD domain-containing protein [Thiomicrorhabdus sp. 6S3-12]MBO1923435.1 HDOD domain-containing protein [Thiomicrorhabdus sp. 6S3-12]